MTPAALAADARSTLRRWAYCRCTYARSPGGACRCTEADLRRAERETPEQTRRWERRLAKEATE